MVRERKNNARIEEQCANLRVVLELKSGAGCEIRECGASDARVQ